MMQRLGDYIRPVDVRNRDLKVTRLLGVSINKEFMPSIANIVGTDLSAYKVVYKGQFAYGPVTSRNGDKISVALLREDDAIISQAYEVFEIADTNALDPEYLMMWFRRPEFDRYARFHSHGSAREVFDWDEMCEVQVPVPDINEQRNIVAEYKTLQTRIETNKKLIATLEQTAQTLYRHTFIDNIDPNNLPEGWKTDVLESFVDVKRGGSPRPIQDYMSDKGFPWLKISDATADDAPFILDIKECIKESGLNKTVFLKRGALVLSNSATPGIPKILDIDSCVHDGWLYFLNSKFSREYLYLFFKENRQNLVSEGNGSIFTNLKTDIVKSCKICVAPKDVYADFQKNVEPLFNMILTCQRMHRVLTNLVDMILCKCS